MAHGGLDADYIRYYLISSPVMPYRQTHMVVPVPPAPCRASCQAQWGECSSHNEAHTQYSSVAYVPLQRPLSRHRRGANFFLHKLFLLPPYTSQLWWLCTKFVKWAVDTFLLWPFPTVSLCVCLAFIFVCVRVCCIRWTWTKEATRKFSCVCTSCSRHFRLFERKPVHSWILQHGLRWGTA